jgi:catechol 2,3-dioxygenase-like lactoylglutathione lyase family enzyme
VPSPFKATRDVIVRTDRFAEAARFYESVLGFAIVHRGDSLLGFEAGAFRLYVEDGSKHGPVFDFLVPDMQAARRVLMSAGCAVAEGDSSVPRCYIRDPYGLVFNIEQRRTADAADDPAQHPLPNLIRPRSAALPRSGFVCTGAAASRTRSP